MTQISQISLSSNIHSHQRNEYSPSKYQKSTQGGSKSNRTFDSKSSISKTNILNQQIYKIQQAQSQMQKRFEKCIDSLIKQIQQKQNLNNILQKEVLDLKENIQQSKKDIQTIVGYVKKNIKSKNIDRNIITAVPSQKNIEMNNGMRNLKNSIEGKSPKKLLIKGLNTKQVQKL